MVGFSQVVAADLLTQVELSSVPESASSAHASECLEPPRTDSSSAVGKIAY